MTDDFSNYMVGLDGCFIIVCNVPYHKCSHVVRFHTVWKWWQRPMTTEELFNTTPRCWAIFDKYIELYLENCVRKIVWVYQKLKKEGNFFYWTDIGKGLGVKKKNMQSIVPYLMKHTKAKTVSQIIALWGN